MTPTWRKSSRSGSSGSDSDCVEVARFSRNIGVRDSKDPDGPKLTLSPDAWRSLVHRVKADDETA
ncbi:DUF397 domain-containing protein [Actinomadura barringtoniae]|uniref:DUF397 domain-containing protein n=1 Tax=Actinomadura barringtoniae TaxID=1427535 RepID=A0A939PVP6_9ACTN|nr:DUF397 domain-containing protein [Actinomadura barringtoniae]MBO2455869.1 DUF397 domain-containing protein [Actinomadura barringtoniae]